MPESTLDELAAASAAHAQRLDALTKEIAAVRENVHRNNNLHMGYEADLKRLRARSALLERSLVALEDRVRALRNDVTAEQKDADDAG